MVAHQRDHARGFLIVQRTENSYATQAPMVVARIAITMCLRFALRFASQHTGQMRFYDPL
tara:strand:- start:672 stop:851 length:180 start_codon:yes stop_codon:yes gene_type:complete